MKFLIRVLPFSWNSIRRSWKLLCMLLRNDHLLCERSPIHFNVYLMKWRCWCWYQTTPLWHPQNQCASNARFAIFKPFKTRRMLSKVWQCVNVTEKHWLWRTFGTFRNFGKCPYYEASEHDWCFRTLLCEEGPWTFHFDLRHFVMPPISWTVYRNVSLKLLSCNNSLKCRTHNVYAMHNM